MKKLLVLMAITVIFASCGMPIKKHAQESTGTRLFATTDSVFSEYISKFEQEGKKYYGNDFKVGDIPVNFGDTGNPDFDGVCIMYSNGTREVLIKKEWWDNRGVTSKEMMIFHELGHCRLDKDHDNETVPVEHGTVKVSLMNSVLPSATTYIQYKAGYLAELFQSTKEVLKNLVASK